ncbi:hypothetical protein [Maridesulfovibrio ferrireducens]|uniref:hypothetical protein n=1 Tax=Maridesulfovibrio ferrireducens TaxID=246191 RepID=UPI001A2E1648|nr:hypothetical protein [Maridesulfovibrio ferrireducens]MBI9110004.1 hypothetical protein [Maridesulfovibrio ferrireducens]
MNFTLPSGLKVVLKSLSRKKAKELNQLKKLTMKLMRKVDSKDEAVAEKAAEDLFELNGAEKRAELILGLYPDLAANDDMDQRDLLMLMTVTEDYTNNVPEAVIKNLSRSGSPAQTSTE